MGKDENLPEQPLDEENEIGVVEVGHAPWGEGRKNDRGENEGSYERLTATGREAWRRRSQRSEGDSLGKNQD